MDNPYLKQYRFVMKTLAPVFIGGGKDAGKKEYVFDRDKNTIMFFDVRKLYNGLEEQGLMPAFQDYMLKDNRDLFTFFCSNNVKPAVYQQWASYNIPVGDRGLINHSTKNIALFVKDPYGKPYIPGSSLKGMLRTILENAYYLDETHADMADRMADQIDREIDHKKGRRYYLTNENREMAEDAFHRRLFPDKHGKYTKWQLREMVNDCMRGLIVSDSRPLEPSDLCVCQKIDVSKAGKENPSIILRECIKPGIQIAFQITLDTKLFPMTVHDIIVAMRQFYKNYQAVYMNRFQNVPKTFGNSTTFFLGGGAGYVSKTATYAVFPPDEAAYQTGKILNNTQPKKHKHFNDKKLGVSPHMLKCTRYNNRMYQMGACCLVSFK